MVGGMGWEKMEEADSTETHVEVQVDASQLPLVDGPDGDKVFRFYWLDAFEDHYSQPGQHLLHPILFTQQCSASHDTHIILATKTLS